MTPAEQQVFNLALKHHAPRCPRSGHSESYDNPRTLRFPCSGHHSQHVQLCSDRWHDMDEAVKALVADRQVRCTDLSASWCARCGDCLCPRREDGDICFEEADAVNCPLHAWVSKHAVSVTKDTLDTSAQ